MWVIEFRLDKDGKFWFYSAPFRPRRILQKMMLYQQDAADGWY
jgi:hypothetical protein